jgi:hypothetical protein
MSLACPSDGCEVAKGWSEVRSEFDSPCYGDNIILIASVDAILYCRWF